MIPTSPITLPALPTGAVVVVTCTVRVPDKNGCARRLLPGDRLVVSGHAQGDVTAVCVQTGPSACRVRVPASLLRKVG